MKRKKICLAFLLILGLLVFAACADYDGVPEPGPNNGGMDNNGLNGIDNNRNDQNGMDNNWNGPGNNLNNGTPNTGPNNNNGNLNQKFRGRRRHRRPRL